MFYQNLLYNWNNLGPNCLQISLLLPLNGAMIGNHVIMTGLPYYLRTISNFCHISQQQHWLVGCKLKFSPENNQLLLLFYSKGSSFSAQAFSISSQASSDKSVECIEKKNLICNSMTSNYCCSPVLNKTQIPLTHRKL